MSLWQTQMPLQKAKVDQWLKKLAIDLPWEGDQGAFIEEFGLGEWSDSLGTIGSGNHFAEIQKVEKILEPEFAQLLGLLPDKLQLMVHSGSRGLGERILRRHTDVYGGQGLCETSAEAKKYLASHEEALQFAKANRTLIGRRLLHAIGADGAMICDMMHNLVVQTESGWLHRKGAAPSDQPFVLIPGSRGDFSYIVRPVSNAADHGWSLAHAAGRRWDRGSTRSRLEGRYAPASLLKTRLGSRVLCENRDLLYEEAPQAYKDIDRVIQDLVDAELAKVVAVMRPVLTYKTNGERNRCKC